MKKSKLSNVKGFPNYHIGEDGSVLNLKTNKLLKPWVNAGGYLCVSLCSHGEQKSFLLHRLVALAYLPNPEMKEFVMHLDDNPRNAHLSNLKWGTPRDNVQDAINKNRNSKHIGIYISGKYGDDHPKTKIKSNVIPEIANKYNSGDYTYKQLACEYGVSSSTMHRIIKIYNHV